MTTTTLTGVDEVSLPELARRIHEEMFSGKATLDDIAQVIVADHHDVFVRTFYKSLKTQIRRGLIAKDTDGLPNASSIDGAGTYVQRRLFDPEAYLTVIQRYAMLGATDHRVARRLAEECEAVHGVSVDVESIISSAEQVAS